VSKNHKDIYKVWWPILFKNSKNPITRFP